MEMLVPIFGGTRQTMQKIMDELIIGHPMWLNYLANAKKAPKTEEVANRQSTELIKTNFEAMTTAWGAMTNAIFSDKKILEAETAWITEATKAINTMNQNAPAVVKFLTFFSDWALTMVQMAGLLTGGPAKILDDQQKDALKRDKKLFTGDNRHFAPGSATGVIKDAVMKFGKQFGGTASEAWNTLQKTVGEIPLINSPGAMERLGKMKGAAQVPAPVRTGPWITPILNHPLPGMHQNDKAPPPPGLTMNINYNGPVIGHIPADHARGIATAIAPHLDKLAFNNKSQNLGAISIGQGNSLPLGIGGQTT
jgi:hypothetical protein